MTKETENKLRKISFVGLGICFLTLIALEIGNPVNIIAQKNKKWGYINEKGIEVELDGMPNNLATIGE